MTTKTDLLESTVRTSPAVAVSGMTFAGVTLSEWVYLLTIVWLVIQMGDWAWKKWKNYGSRN